MAAHAKFSPSKMERIMECPGSVALESDAEDTRSDYANEGTGAHHIAAICLKNGDDADGFVGNSFDVDEHGETTILPGDKGKFKIDEQFAAYVQVYIDTARRRSHGANKTLLVEQRVEFSQAVGVADQFGTSDAVIIDFENGVLEVGDLKFGVGVKVYASEPWVGMAQKRKGNKQLLTYAAGTLETMEDILPQIKTIRIWISQPRIDHFDEYELSIDELHQHIAAMRSAVNTSQVAVAMYDNGKDLGRDFFKPGDKQCKFCKAAGFCPALREFVADTVAADFAALNSEQSVQQVIAGPALRPSSPKLLGQLYGVLDIVEGWVKAVRSETDRMVTAGMEVIGPDGLRMKLVEGKKGNRAWADEEMAEGLLLGHLPPEKAYQPRKIITASAAATLLDKKKTKETWESFRPLIKQSPGRPTVVLGSDPRPEYTGGAAEDSEFEAVSNVES